MAFTHIGELTGHRGTHWHGAHLDVWGRLANRRGTNTQRTVHMKPLRGMAFTLNCHFGKTHRKDLGSYQSCVRV